MSKFKDETGKRFSRLVVLKRVENANNGQTQWLCQCDCGNQCVVTASNLRRGKQVSCGCYGKQIRAKNDVPTELRKTRLYHIWQCMQSRCYNKAHNRYHIYGGRGITVCDEWLNDFRAFYKWAMENGYQDNLSIDRINNEDGYNPSNCRWATATEQANNRRNSRKLTYNGETHTIAEWCKRFKVKPSTISARMYSGWEDPEEILFGRKRKVGKAYV